MGYGPHLTNIVFILLSLWWIGFAQSMYRVIPNNPFRKKPEADYIWKGTPGAEIVYKEFMQTTRLKKYLYAFFFFNSGVQTVMLLATIFASKSHRMATRRRDHGPDYCHTFDSNSCCYRCKINV